MIQAARTAKVLLRALFKDTTRRPKDGPVTTCDRTQYASKRLRGLEPAALAPGTTKPGGGDVAKKGRKRRNRRKSKANHGKRPNAGRK